MARRQTKAAKPAHGPHRFAVTATGVLLFLVEVVVLPGAQSPFRLPKEALAVAGLAAVVGLDLATRVRRGRLELPTGALASVLAVYPLLLAASALWSARPSWALGAAARAAVWVVAMLWLATVDDDRRLRLARWAAVGAAVSAVAMLFQAAGLPVIELAIGDRTARVGLTGLAGNPADLAMSAVLLLPFLVPAEAAAMRRLRVWVLPALLATAVLVSQTMAGVVALLALAGVWLVRQRSGRVWIGAAAALVLIASIALATGLGGRVADLMGRLERGDWYALFTARGDGWSAAAEMVRRDPLHGVGAAHFTHAFYGSRLAYLERHGTVGGRSELATHFEWAHCDPLQLVAELGAFGGLWLLVLLVVVARALPRGDPLPLLGLAALLPFALLHYPTHVAVGLVPLALLMGHLLGPAPRLRPDLPQPVGSAVAVVLAAAAVTVVVAQARRVNMDLWAGTSERILVASQQAPPAQRAAMGATVERQAFARAQSSPADAPWLWRVVGRARYARGDAAGAEQAFRTAFALWPHEEAELGLGLAYAAQGRPEQAVPRLERVCRVNPSLVRYITDEGVRRVVETYLETTAARGRR